MKTVAIVVIVLVVLLVIVLAVLAGRRNRRRAALRERFGPEYDLALKRGKDRRAVEQRLEQLAKQRDQLDIREVPVQEHVRLARDWDGAQSRFVDDPGQAVADADGLVNSVLRSRGYPVESFDDRAALMATDHQDVVEDYRNAHDTFAGHLQGGAADTEALRHAFLQYREVFGRLNVPDGEVRNAGEQEAVAAAPARREVEAGPAVVGTPGDRPVDADRPQDAFAVRREDAERPVNVNEVADRGAAVDRPVEVDRREDGLVEPPVQLDRREDAVADLREDGIVDRPAQMDRRDGTAVDVRDEARADADADRPVDPERREDTVVDLRDDARTDAARDGSVNEPAPVNQDDQPPRERRVAAHRADPA